MSQNKNDGRCYRCKLCDNLAHNTYREANLEKFQMLSRSRSIKHRYGITQEQYNTILADQNGVCAICGSTSTRGTHSFSIDHCHTTGKVRGLLCNNCNRGLGLLGDRPETLLKALTYLNK